MQDVETYVSHNKNSPKYSKISKILRDNEQLFDWRPEEKILDAGCGPGDVTVNALIPWLPPDFQLVMGVDVSPTMVDHALAAHASNKLTFATWDIEQDVTDVLKNGKFASGFDKVFSFYVLHWLQDLGKGVRNLHSLLKTRGQALLFFPVDRIFQRTYKKVRASETWSRYFQTVTRKIPPFPKEDPLAEFENMLIDAGFEIMKSEIRDHIDDFRSVEDVTALVESLDPDIAHVPVDLKASYLRDCLQVMDQMEVLNLERTSIKQKMLLCVIRKP
uniref:Methyltransferase type 12 domain-containing protein n=1 Tax=Homalodisca liturata TaxID=320908 RepID=A0A1B6HI10_9HEMI